MTSVKAMQEIRKHIAWYFKGYQVGGEARRRLSLVSSLAGTARDPRWPRPRPALPGGNGGGSARPSGDP